MESTYNLRLQDYTNSLKYSTIKLYASIFGLVASVALLFASFYYTKDPNVSDALTIIPFLTAIFPAWWIYKYKNVINNLALEIKQELKKRLADRKKLEEVKFALCEFFLELFGAEAVKLELINSFPVTRPYEIDPRFNSNQFVQMSISKPDRSGKQPKITTGRFIAGPFSGYQLTKLQIELIDETPLGSLVITTKKGMSADNKSLLSLIEDEIDIWLTNAIERFKLELIIEIARIIDNLANMVDSEKYSVSYIIKLLLDDMAIVTSSRNVFANLLNKCWQGSKNTITWQDQDWRQISGRYRICKEKFGDPGYEQVERFTPESDDESEMILLPIYFDNMKEHLGCMVFESNKFQVGVEKALAIIEDLVLDNLIKRIVTAENRK